MILYKEGDRLSATVINNIQRKVEQLPSPVFGSKPSYQEYEDWPENYQFKILASPVDFSKVDVVAGDWKIIGPTGTFKSSTTMPIQDGLERTAAIPPSDPPATTFYVVATLVLSEGVPTEVTCKLQETSATNYNTQRQLGVVTFDAAGNVIEIEQSQLGPIIVDPQDEFLEYFRFKATKSSDSKTVNVDEGGWSRNNIYVASNASGLCTVAKPWVIASLDSEDYPITLTITDSEEEISGAYYNDSRTIAKAVYSGSTIDRIIQYTMGDIVDVRKKLVYRWYDKDNNNFTTSETEPTDAIYGLHSGAFWHLIVTEDESQKIHSYYQHCVPTVNPS